MESNIPAQLPGIAKIINQNQKRKELVKMSNEFKSTNNKGGVVVASEINPFIPEFAIPGILQFGCGTMILGEGGSGKTALAMALAAAVSGGHSILDMPATNPGTVLIISMGDDPGTLRVMLEENKAALHKCYIVQKPFGLTLGSAELEALLVYYQPKLVIIDPVESFLGSKTDDPYSVLAETVNMAQEHNCAFVFTSSVTDSLRYMRNAYEVSQPKTNQDERELMVIKGNKYNTTSLICRIGAKRKVNFLKTV